MSFLLHSFLEPPGFRPVCEAYGEEVGNIFSSRNAASSSHLTSSFLSFFLCSDSTAKKDSNAVSREENDDRIDFSPAV